MFGLGVAGTLGIVVSILAIGTIVIDRIYQPNAKQDITITEMQGDIGKTNLKVDTNTKCIEEIGKDVKEIKDNHLAHLKRDINIMGNDIIEIKTMLKK